MWRTKEWFSLPTQKVRSCLSNLRVQIFENNAFWLHLKNATHRCCGRFSVKLQLSVFFANGTSQKLSFPSMGSDSCKLLFRDISKRKRPQNLWSAFCEIAHWQQSGFLHFSRSACANIESDCNSRVSGLEHQLAPRIIKTTIWSTEWVAFFEKNRFQTIKWWFVVQPNKSTSREREQENSVSVSWIQQTFFYVPPAFLDEKKQFWNKGFQCCLEILTDTRKSFCEIKTSLFLSFLWNSLHFFFRYQDAFERAVAQMGFLVFLPVCSIDQDFYSLVNQAETMLNELLYPKRHCQE